MTDPITLTAQNDALHDIIRSQSAEIDRLKAEVERLEYELSGYRRAATVIPPRDTLPSPRVSFDGPVDWDDSPLLMTLLPPGASDGECP